jgi:hypothetical protein
VIEMFDGTDAVVGCIFSLEVFLSRMLLARDVALTKLIDVDESRSARSRARRSEARTGAERAAGLTPRPSNEA